MSNGSGLFTNKGPQKPHLAKHGETWDLRVDVAAALLPIAAVTVDEFTNPVAASANAIKTAIASVAALTTYSGAALNGSVGAAVMSPARNITITTAGTTPADAPATATITGTYLGAAQSETITVAQTATIATGVKPFDTVTGISLPAADGTGATLAFGIGTGMGTGKKVKARAGGAVLVAENMDGTKPTAGAFTSAGLYTPNTAPDGAHDYCIYYEMDPLA